MSEYCTVADVQQMMQTTFTLTSRPTIEQVKGLITTVSSRLNGTAQAAGYTVPVTDTLGLTLMNNACAYGTSCAAWHAGYGSMEAPARVEYWCKEYKDFLAALRKGEVELPGLTPESDLDPAFGIVPQPPRDRLWTGDNEYLE